MLPAQTRPPEACSEGTQLLCELEWRGTSQGWQDGSSVWAHDPKGPTHQSQLTMCSVIDRTVGMSVCL